MCVIDASHLNLSNGPLFAKIQDKEFSVDTTDLLTLTTRCCLSGDGIVLGSGKEVAS